MTDASLTIRSARAGDLPEIVAMLADDPLGADRETATEPLPAAYFDAFEEITQAMQDSQLIWAHVCQPTLARSVTVQTLSPGHAHEFLTLLSRGC